MMVLSKIPTLTYLGNVMMDHVPFIYVHKVPAFIQQPADPTRDTRNAPALQVRFPTGPQLRSFPKKVTWEASARAAQDDYLDAG